MREDELHIADPTSGYRALALEVITHAIEDWQWQCTLTAARRASWEKKWKRQEEERRAARGKKYHAKPVRPNGKRRALRAVIDACNQANRLGFESPREELLAFFRSEWLDTLCSASRNRGIAPEIIRARCGLVG